PALRADPAGDRGVGLFLPDGLHRLRAARHRGRPRPREDQPRRQQPPRADQRGSRGDPAQAAQPRIPVRSPVEMIAPHGGRLINRLATGEQRDKLLARAKAAPKLKLNAREMADLEMIAVGAMSPLEGFMGSADLKGVVTGHRLANGVLWAMPVTLSNK